MSRLIDLTGRTFGRLTVVRRAESSRPRRVAWLVQCACGSPPKSVAGNDIKRGTTVSCGCHRREQTAIAGARTAAQNSRAGAAKGAAARTRHGHCAIGVNSRMYSTWEAMIARCGNPHAKKYDLYGGRGIAVCERWRSFENFLADMGPHPGKGLTLDRFPNGDGNYEPSNCRWATYSEQNRNLRTNVRVEFGGERLLLLEWAERTGIPEAALSSRLRRGWTPEEALTTPAGTRCATRPLPGGRAGVKRRAECVRYGEDSPAAKLTAEAVRAIRVEHANGATLKLLGEKYGVRPTNIAHIVTRATWSHV